MTRYVPAGRAGTPTSNRTELDGSTRLLPWSTLFPLAFSTVIVLKAGSISPSNHIYTPTGGAERVDPTLGSEWSGKACPRDTPGKTSSDVNRKDATAILRFMLCIIA